MNPPAEQLVRDYLNRLSVAARGRLGFRDRQALLDQTRARIEVQSGGVASASAAQVLQALADLGDPVALVEAEHARVGAAGMVAAGFLLRARHAEPAEPLLQAPVPAGGSQADDRLGMSAADGAGGDSRRSGSEPGSLIPMPGISPESLVGQQAADLEEDAGTEAGALELYVDPAASDEFRSELVQGQATAQDWLRGATVGLAGLLSGFFHRLIFLAWNNKVEAVAVLLLGVGGALFPPIWVLGVPVAVTSKVWDIRDKWVAVALPVLLVLIGTAFIIVFGGQRDTLGSYAIEAWVGAGRLFRLMAVAGASYLAWRLHRGRRQPRQPPWNIPHKLDL